MLSICKRFGHFTKLDPRSCVKLCLVLLAIVWVDWSIATSTGSTAAPCTGFSDNDGTAAPADSNLPNVIVFLVDDMGLMDTSVPMLTDDNGAPVMHPLNKWYQTPNMEKLAATGIRFSIFYAQSVCSPTRVSILTGQNAARHRTTNWIRPSENNRGKFGPPEWNWAGLDSESITLPRLLQQKGYRTIHVGKAHLGPNDHDGCDPLKLGFEVNVGGHSAGHPASYYGKDNYGNDEAKEKPGVHAVPHLEKYHGTETYLTEALTIEANRCMQESVADGKPFFLHMAHYAVHSPFHSDPRFAKKYSKAEGRSKQQKAFATMIEGIDKSLGDIVGKVNELGVADNTLLIFLGDNGSDARIGKPKQHGSSAPLRGMKATEFEGGMRVPFIASWLQADQKNEWQQALPIAAGEIQQQLGTVNDLMPTILSLVGQEVPEGYAVDGTNLATQLNGKRNVQRSETFLMHYPHQHRGSYFTTYRDGDWKLIYYYQPKKDGKSKKLLYNLKEDPYENSDLASKQPEQLHRMINKMKRQLEAENAIFPVDSEGNELRPETKLVGAEQ